MFFTEKDTDRWCEDFINREKDILTLSLKEIVRKAFVDGMNHMEEEMPHFGISEKTGEIVQIPFEREMTLPEGGRWIDEDDDFDYDAELLKLKEKKEMESRNAGK